MEQRPLGQTGIRAGVIALGTVKLGRSAGVKYPAPVRIPTDDEALALLTAAHDLGVNLIDTAPAYGSSESRLGALIHRVAPRERWVLCTKVGEEFQAQDGQGRSHHDFSPAAIDASVLRSLKHLRTNVLDIVLLHFSSAVDDAAVLRDGQALAALRRLKDKGLIRAIGASTSTPAGGLLAVDAGCDVLMLTLNPQSAADAPVAQAAGAKGLGVLVKKALASGHAALGANAPQSAAAALNWVLKQPGISCAVVGTTSIAHLTANVQAVSPPGALPPPAP